MFHQIKVLNEHRDVLLFLWWNNADLKGEPSMFRMTVHLFSRVWSPSCAAYALQQTFRDYGASHASELSKVIRNFYVDDLLWSTNSADDAITLSKHVASLLSLGGFWLTKWVSNRREVLDTIPYEEQSEVTKELILNYGG